MAGSKGSKYYNVFLKYRVWLITRSEEEIIDDNHFELLKLIDKYGSLKKAAKEQQISYRNAWGSLKRAEDILNLKLIDKQRGGKMGGETRLTDEGSKLIQCYDALRKEFDQAVYNVTKKFFHSLNE
jgi:molybdate transport system regulatory protein